MSDFDSQPEYLITFLRELNRSRDLKSLAQVVLEHAVSLVGGAERGSFMLMNEETNSYEFIAAVGWPVEMLRQIAVPASQMLQRVVYGDRPAIIRDPYEQDREKISPEVAELLESYGPNRAILSFPIRHGGEVIAYLNLDSPDNPDAFCEQDFDLLEVVQQEIAVALQAVLGRERLAELEEFFRLLFERLADAVYIAEFDGTIVRANRAASEQSGYTLDELTGMNIMRDLACREPKLTYKRAVDLLNKGEVVRFEEVKQRKDRSLYVTDCAVTVFEYRGQKVTLSVNRDITERREAERRLERRNREQEALLTASRALSSTLELEELLHRMREQVTELISCDSFFIALLDRRRRELLLEVMVERGVSLGKYKVDAAPSNSLTAWVAHTGEPLLVGDLESEPLPAAFRQVGDPTRSWLGVPLLAKGEPIGVMSVQSLAPQAFSEDDLRLLSAFAGLAAAAISNAELHAGVASLQGKLLAVERVARKMKLAEGKDELYRQLVGATREIFGYEICGIAEPREGALKVVQGGDTGGALEAPLTLAGLGIAAAAWGGGRTEYIPDVRLDPRYVEGAPQTRSELAIPFWVGARQAGVFDVQSPLEDAIPPEDRNLLEILVSHMAVSLAGLERLETMRSLSSKLEQLHHAVDELQKCSNVEELCWTAVRTAADVLGMSECNIGLAEGEYLVPVASAGRAREMSRPLRRGEAIAGRTWETGKTVWGKIGDFPEARPTDPEFKAFVSVPMGEEGVFQAITVSDEGFAPSDVTLAEILVGHVQGELKRIRLEETLREQATRDGLTGLYNRRFLSEVLEREMARARRYAHPISVIMADIDDFKQVNDRFGHLKGDQTLREVAAILQEAVRESDYVFRYGGEEFVVLMPETADLATQVIERLKEAVGRWAQSAGLGDLQFGLTMGWAMWDPQTGEGATPDSVLHKADQVLYSFKQRKGR